MAHFPYDVSNDDIVAFVDEWVKLLEAEDYDQAFRFTAHAKGSTLTPTSFRDHVLQQAELNASCFDDDYGELPSSHRVTLDGKPTPMAQVKEVERWATNARGLAGSVWYNLNFDGFASEYTALFDIVDDGNGLTLALVDIGVR